MKARHWRKSIYYVRREDGVSLGVVMVLRLLSKVSDVRYNREKFPKQKFCERNKGIPLRRWLMASVALVTLQFSQNPTSDSYSDRYFIMEKALLIEAK